MSLMLDTYAIIELFRGSERGEKVKKLIEKEDAVCLSALSLYETGTVLERQVGKKKALEYLRSIQTYYQVLNVDKEIALKAMELKRDYRLPAIDCLIYASARIIKANVVSGCIHFRDLSKQKDVIII